MPRVATKKANGDYVGKDFSRYVRGLGKTDREIGAIIGVTSQCISKKRRSGSWKPKEMCLIFKATKATDEDILRVMKI